jgi:hypothetical protein
VEKITVTNKSKSPFLAEMGRRWIWGIAAALIGLCVSGVCLAIFLVLISMSDNSDTGVMLLIGFGALVILGMVAAMVAVLFVVPMLRGRKFDTYFTPLGLAGRSYALFWRQYEGLIGGRRVSASVSRGPNYRLTIHSPVDARLGVGTRTGVGSAFGGLSRLIQVSLDYPELSGVYVWSRDEQWARSLFDDESVRAAFARLLSQRYGSELRSINVGQDGVLLSIAYSRIAELNEESVRSWFDDLIRITEAAEALPPAAQPVD